MNSPKLVTLKTKGFTLIEVLITVIITSIGILGVSILQLESLKASQDAITRTKAVNLVSDITDRIRSNRAALNYENRETYKADDSDPGATPAKNCLDVTITYTPANPISTPYCTTAELAAYDVWEWKRLLANAKSGLAGSEVKGKITRENDFFDSDGDGSDDAIDNVLFTITVSWKNEKEAIDKARSYVLQFQP